MKCHYCKRPYSEEEIRQKKEAKAQNGRNSATKKRTVNVEQVNGLRKSGLIIREIAHILNCSESAVYRALKVPNER